MKQDAYTWENQACPTNAKCIEVPVKWQKLPTGFGLTLFTSSKLALWVHILKKIHSSHLRALVS